MYVACPECTHQYDVGELALGSKFLCHCGIYIRIPEQHAREAVTSHCGACGGVVSKGALRCEYCGSGVSAADHGVGELCPSCFARMLKGAKFCSGCGLKISVEKLHDQKGHGDCPRCEIAMFRRPVAGGSIDECTGCGGLWLSNDFFKDLVESKGQQAVLSAFGRPSQSKLERGEMTSEQSRGYVPCPCCHRLMNRKNFASISGVIIDWCRDHGYWFDAFELERILDFVRQGGMVEAKEHRANRAERKAQAAKRSLSASSTPYSHMNNPGYTDTSMFDAGVLVSDLLCYVLSLFNRKR